MATLAIGLAGAALGTGIGGTILGVTATSIGFAVGSLAGSYVDNLLFGSGSSSSGRLDDLSVQVSSYGCMLPICYHGRYAGNIIWSTDLIEVESDGGGGKGLASGASSSTYEYYVNMAVSLAEGPIAALRQCWADGTLIWDAYDQGKSLDGVTFYYGLHDQAPDPLIESHEGSGNVPGYRDQAYVVFENFYLTPYGNRIPNLTFEVIGKLAAAWGEDLAQGLAQGTDGQLWVACNLQRTVWRFSPDQFIPQATIGRDASNATDYLGSLRAQPWRLACDPTTGHIFVTNLCDASVQRIDPATNKVVASIDVKIYPHEIIADGLGGVWLSHPLLDKLSRIDVATNSVTTRTMTGQPFAFCRDADNNLWISCTNEIVHFDAGHQYEKARIALGSRWFPGGLAYNGGDGKIWFACSGNDIVGVVNPSTYDVSWRNTGTWPAYMASHPDDPQHTVFVSCLFGNRLKLLKRDSDEGLNEFFEFKTEVWPGPVLATAEGHCLVSNTNRPFFQLIEGPT